MTAADFLESGEEVTDRSVRRALKGNICRCTGYENIVRAVRAAAGQDVPKPDTVIGPHDDIAYDPVISQKWDYEAEVAIIIGRDGRSIPEDKAMDHVFGLSVANDVSHRDLQRRHGGQWLKGKSIDHTMPLGPWITTLDDITDPYALTIQCELNGRRLQYATTAQMAFRLEQLIAELSWGMTLRAGDLILTGTPSGIGNAREPQIFLDAGDTLVTRVTRVSGLGELRNKIIQTQLTTSE